MGVLYCNWAYNKLTGQDRPLVAGKGGPLRVGQQFWDSDQKMMRTATQKDVQDAAKLQGRIYADQIASAGESENATLAKYVDPHKIREDEDEKEGSFSDGPTPGV